MATVEGALTFPVFTVRDPLNLYPEQVTIKCLAHAIQITDSHKNNQIESIPWTSVSHFSAERQSEDPTDMEIFGITTTTAKTPHLFEIEDACLRCHI